MTIGLSYPPHLGSSSSASPSPPPAAPADSPDHCSARSSLRASTHSAAALQGRPAPVAAPVTATAAGNGNGNGNGNGTETEAETEQGRSGMASRAVPGWIRARFRRGSRKGGGGGGVLARQLGSRHLQMIAIGGCIGTGLFIGTGSALAAGGPGALLLSFGVVGVMMFCTVQALGEMAVLFPVAGSFSVYASRFLDESWGFAMGWNYALQWLVVLPLEIIAASLTIGYWNPPVHPRVWVGLFLGLVVGLNLFGIRGYAEAEFVFSLVKIVAVAGFILAGIVINARGLVSDAERAASPLPLPPPGRPIGALYWAGGNGFRNGLHGTCTVFTVAAFAFAGTELVGLAAAETANPRRSLPAAVKQVFWRILFFYLLSILVLGFTVPADHPALIGNRPGGGGSSFDSAASPFVIALARAGIPALPSVMNGVIMLAVLSVGNSSVYGSSRTMAALAEQGQAPAPLGYVDARGRPIVGIGLACACGLLAFIVGTPGEAAAFDWLLAVSGLSAVFTWASICLAHIRFRAGWKAQGHSLDELAYRSQAGVAGSWVGLVLNLLVLVTQAWVGLTPAPADPDAAGPTGRERAYSFFSVFLAMPVTALFYVGYKLYYRTAIVRSYNMDLHTGIRELNIPELVQAEKAERAGWSRSRRAWKLFC